jgi:acyl carrier protein
VKQTLHMDLETGIRSVVADVLGVGADELAPEVSLIDDLAADSLDLAELAVALETDLGLRIPERVLGAVRTYGDLLAAAGTLAGAHGPRTAAWEPVVAVPVFARLVGAAPAVVFERSETLTPYAVETITEDAVHGGPGTTLELTVPHDTTPAALARVRACFAGLPRHGVAVSVRRGTAGGGGLLPREREAAA